MIFIFMVTTPKGLESPLTISADPVVCRCMKVCQSRVEGAIAAGARDVEAVTRTCGAGDACTCCHKKIALLIQRGAAGTAICVQSSRVLPAYK